MYVTCLIHLNFLDIVTDLLKARLGNASGKTPPRLRNNKEGGFFRDVPSRTAFVTKQR
jgi:hypothetical protein